MHYTLDMFNEHIEKETVDGFSEFSAQQRLCLCITYQDKGKKKFFLALRAYLAYNSHVANFRNTKHWGIVQGQDSGFWCR